MELKEHWNYRVLIVDDEAGIHSDFKDMLNPNRTQALTDQLAEALLDEGSENKTSFLPDFELLHATSGEEAYDIIRAG
jgi:CheY-like chemotaxis protein